MLPVKKFQWGMTSDALPLQVHLESSDLKAVLGNLQMGCIPCEVRSPSLEIHCN